MEEQISRFSDNSRYYVVDRDKALQQRQTANSNQSNNYIPVQSHMATDTNYTNVIVMSAYDLLSLLSVF